MKHRKSRVSTNTPTAPTGRTNHHGRKDQLCGGSNPARVGACEANPIPDQIHARWPLAARTCQQQPVQRHPDVASEPDHAATAPEHLHFKHPRSRAAGPCQPLPCTPSSVCPSRNLRSRRRSSAGGAGGGCKTTLIHNVRPSTVLFSLLISSRSRQKSHSQNVRLHPSWRPLTSADTRSTASRARGSCS